MQDNEVTETREYTVCMLTYMKTEQRPHLEPLEKTPQQPQHKPPQTTLHVM